MDIGKRLKYVREIHGYTQREVANMIGINPVTYQAYERNRAEPPIRVLISLTEMYRHFSIDLLLNLRSEEIREEFIIKYRAATPEAKKIVDYILSLNN